MKSWHIVLMMLFAFPFAIVLTNYLIMHCVFGLGSPWDDWLSILWWILLVNPVEEGLWRRERRKLLLP